MFCKSSAPHTTLHSNVTSVFRPLTQAAPRQLTPGPNGNRAVGADTSGAGVGLPHPTPDTREGGGEDPQSTPGTAAALRPGGLNWEEEEGVGGCVSASMTRINVIE